VTPIEIGGPEFAIATLAVFVGSALQGAVGFGFALVVAPVLFLVDPLWVPGPIIFSALVLTSLTAIRERDAIDYRGLVWGLAGRLPGTFAGAAMVAAISAEQLATPLGLLVLLAVAISISTVRFEPGPRTLFGAGLLSGFMGTASSIGGPPMALVYQHGPGDRLRATLGAYFVVGAVMSLAALAVVGRFGAVEAWLGATLVPGIVLGFTASSRLKDLVDRGYTRRAVLTVAVAAGVGVILRQLW
jgi:uncharacterized membrane protein YfcA